jgi:hypothetical protein
MIDNIYKTIDKIIQAQKKARRENDYLTLMLNGEALLEYIPELIIYSIGQESEYRKFESSVLDEKDENGKSRTSSYAETKAKAQDSYREWRKTSQFLELIYELVNMSKALGRSVNKEFNAS